jgi:hypothetical protein
LLKFARDDNANSGWIRFWRLFDVGTDTHDGWRTVCEHDNLIQSPSHLRLRARSLTLIYMKIIIQ